MSVHKVEHWKISWEEGRGPRSRRLDKSTDAEALAHALATAGHRPSTRHVVYWRVCWREGGRGSPQRQRTFDRKRDADDFDREVKRRKRLGELALWEHRNRTVRELAREWWAKYAVPNLAELTLDGYEPVLSKHVVGRLGGQRVGEVTPEVVADFRAQLERSGVGRHAVRIALVILQAMFKQAIAWGWVATNPVKAVPKPTSKRERAVVCLAPAQVESIRASLIDRNELYAATLVSLVAYQGVRVPEEVLALEVRHVRSNTLLVEQRNIKGKIVGGQKVRRFRPRAIDWIEPARRDVSEYLMASGIRSGLLFPRRDGEPWKVHDYKNWSRRVWHKAREEAKVEHLPPYDLRHAFASLQIRAGLSIPELAEQLGHSPPMTLGTYAHVIRELKGEPRMSAEQQIERARLEAPRLRRVSG